MIDISGRAVRAGIRGFTAAAAASCFVVMPQVTNIASAHTGGKSARAHDHTTPRRDHDGREARDHARGRADVVVDTRGPKGTIVPGRTYEWPFEVTNRGSAPAKDVSLTARPNRNLKVLAAPPKCRWRQSGPLVCDIGLLPQGHTKRGVITATIVPRAHAHGKSLTDPIQVSWRNAPRQERLMAEFPPVEVSPDTGGTSAAPAAAPAADGKIPYPLMVNEHGPVTAESVVVRSPIGIPAPAGPCADGAAPAKIAGKSAAVKPELGPCAAKQDDPAACGCTGAHEAPAVPVPDLAAPDHPAAAPCGTAATRPAVIPRLAPPCAQHRPAAGEPLTAPCGVLPARPATAPARPLVPPCAQSGPAAWADEPAAAPCGVLPARPAVTAGHPALPPCAQDRPVAVPPAAADQPLTAPCGVLPARPAVTGNRPVLPPCAQDRPVAVPPVAVGGPAAAPCHAADRPVILPAPATAAGAAPGAVPGSSCDAAQDKAAAAKPAEAKPAADKPAGAPAEKAADKAVSKAADKAPDEAVAKPADKAAVQPAGVVGGPATAGVPAAAPCGASAVSPGVVPGRPVVVPQVPAIPPCAQARPGACGCLAAQNAPAAPAVEPAVPAVPSVPEAAPCAAADKPVAVGKAAPERPLGPSCAHDAPAAVHQEPAATPDTIEPMTPLAGPGKAAHPLGRPHHPHVLGHPHGLGHAHRDCARQGAGFVCPLGSAPHHRPHVLDLHAPGHPHTLHCVGASTPGCHTREARPVAVRPQPVRGNLPTTGSSSALLALSGIGLAGAGIVLYRLSRTRTRREEG